jgi:hypothetical protein
MDPRLLLTLGNIAAVGSVALTPVNAGLEIGDSNTNHGAGLFGDLPGSYFADDSAGASKIYDARLSGAIVPLVAPTTATVTMTVATPCVVTHNSHGKAAGTTVTYFTTGALPTGVTSGNELFVASPTTNDYKLAATYADAIAGTNLIASSGSQSGTHTATYNCGIEMQSDLYAVNVTANLGRTAAGKYFEYIKQLRIDQATQRMDRVVVGKGSSRFSDAGFGVRATNWDASLTDGAFHDLQVRCAAYTSLLAAEGKTPNWKFCRISGPGNGIVDNTETAAFQTQLTALVAGVRTIVGNSCLIIIERVGNAQNQAAFASYATNVATVRAAQAAVVAAEIAAGRPAVMTNADGFIAADSPTLHWSAGSHDQSERQIYCETNGIWYPSKYSEADQPTHEWAPGAAASLPWPPSSGLSSAWDNVGGTTAIAFQQATSSKQPAFVTAALSNGYPTCRGAQGDGVDDVLFGANFSSQTTVFCHPNTDWGLWGVISGPATANKAFLGMGGAGVNPLIYFGTKSDGSGKLIAAMRDDAGGSTTPQDSGLVLFDGTKHFFFIWKSGSTWNFQVDGTVGTPTTLAPGTTTLTKSSLFAANSNNGTASFHMAATIWKLVTTSITAGSDSTYRANARAFAQRFFGAP